MPITVDILSQHNLVYVRYSGIMRVSETAEAFAEFAENPEARPGQRHLVDMTRLTDYDRDFPKFMELQAAKIETLAGHGVETFIVYLATTPVGRRAATIGRNGWPEGCGVVAVIQDSEEAALSSLGLPYTSITAMLNDGAAQSA